VICKNFISSSEGVVNVGINGYDNFGCEVTTVKQMPNYQYDCTNPAQPRCGTNGGNNNFNYVCIGEVTEKTANRTFYTLEDMIKSKGLFKKNIFLKIDCEGGEFPGLKVFPVELLDYVDQIAGELHFDTIYKEEWGMLDIFRTLMTKFVPVNLHHNNWGCMKDRVLKSKAVEISLVNKRLITLHSETRSYWQHPLNLPNGRSIPDCQPKDN
jgi:hypothetical protein